MQRNTPTNQAVRRRAMAVLLDLGYTMLNGASEEVGQCEATGRRNMHEVVLESRLYAALCKLNPGLSTYYIEAAMERLTTDELRLSGDPLRANREIYRLLRDGIKIETRPDEPPNAAGYRDRHKIVQVIDWGEPANNNFVFVPDLWVAGEMGKRCLDLVLFVNGLPFVLLGIQDCALELIHAQVTQELYRELPRLFWYNAFVVVTNTFECRMGSFSAPWEHFFQWKRVLDEDEPASTTLETLLRGTCEQTRLLDLVENFTLFDEAGGLKKLVARNHQYLGVNRAIAALRAREQLPPQEQHDRLGVFWHTQGSGKSYSMIFFVRKAQRVLANTYKFLIVTDRIDLDEQIYQNFKNTGSVEEADPAEVHAGDGNQLKRLLREPHFILFTLIQKFRVDQPGQNYEKLSESYGIVVITDEAHRTQDGELARYMRQALPHAAFIGFTGTPLMDNDEQTRRTFGDYVSRYTFRRAINDGVTVDLYFENHTPPLELVRNIPLDEKLNSLLEGAQLTPQQQEQLFRDSRFLDSSERLDWIAQDIVEHFARRGYQGKALVVSSSKISAVRTYNRVLRARERYVAGLRAQLDAERDLARREELHAMLVALETCEMAVVVSEAQDDIEKFANFSHASGELVEIEPHQRVSKERLAERFKDPRDPLRIAFVCDMWSTGFDVPCLSTIYLNNRLQKHTLMQTIARANRVFGEKPNGLIIDYAGSVHELDDALALYAPADINDPEGPERVVGNKNELVELLRATLAEINRYCQENGLDIPARLNQLRATSDRRDQELLVEPDIDALLETEERKQGYLLRSHEVSRLYRAILPDPAEPEFTLPVHLHQLLRRGIYAAMRQPLPDGLRDRVVSQVQGALRLGERDERVSLVTREEPGRFLVSQLDLDRLRSHLGSGPRHIRAEETRADLESWIRRLLAQNIGRIHFLERLERIVSRYNEANVNEAVYPSLAEGGEDIRPLDLRTARTRKLDAYADDLVALARDLAAEEQRATREGLSEEELTIYDILTAGVKLAGDDERAQVKSLTRTLLARLQTLFVLDWQSKTTTFNRVRLAITDSLHDGLPPAYNPDQRTQKSTELLLYVRERYRGGRGGAHTVA